MVLVFKSVLKPAFIFCSMNNAIVKCIVKGGGGWWSS